MQLFKKCYLMLCASLSFLCASMLSQFVVADDFRVVGYVPNWIDVEQFAKKIAYDELTHINIAFENPTNAAGDLSFNEKDEILIRLAHKNKVKILVSIGGGGAVENKDFVTWYTELLKPANRQAFSEKLLAYVKIHNLDGIDVDLEGPLVIDDYSGFVLELKRVFAAEGKLVTSALSKGYGGANVGDEAIKAFDFINIMAYDASGPWRPEEAGPHSSMEFTKDAVQYWLDRGLAPDKAVIGVPFYGYGFGDDFTSGGYTYAALVKRFPKAAASDEIGKTIYYNGATTIEAKTQYAIDKKLGGMMIWSINQDASGDQSLLGVIHKTIESAK